MMDEAQPASRSRFARLFAGFGAIVASLYHDPAARCRAWIVVAALLVVGYSAVVLGYVLVTPELGIRCAFTPIVNNFYDEFLYPPTQTALADGDLIIEVAGQPIENWLQLIRCTNRLWGEKPALVEGLTANDLVTDRHGKTHPFVLFEGQRLVRIVYQRPGVETPRVVWCRFGPSPLSSLVPSILWFCLKIGLFVVGAIVLWRRPDDRPAARFFWLCILSLGAYMGGYHWSRIVPQPLLLVVFMACALFLPAVTLHFYLVFPRPKAIIERYGRWLVLAVYGPAMIFFLLLITGYFRLRMLDRGGIGFFTGLDAETTLTGGMSSARVLLVEMLYEIYIYFAIAMLWYLLSLACLIHSFRTAANLTERNQVKWILLGAVAAVIPIGYALYLAVFEQGRFGGGGATWPMFAASACVTIAYTISITRYRLMQIDQLVSSATVYVLISSLAGVVYYGLVFASLLVLGGRGAEPPSLVQVLGVSGTALIFMIALDLARGRIKRALDRHLRREKNQLDRTLQRMSQAVEQLVDPPTLAGRLLHTTAELLNVPAGAVYLRQGVPALYALADHLGAAPALTELPPGCPLVEALRQQPTLAPAPADVSPAHRQLHFLHSAVAQALTHEGQLLGLLLLAPREEQPFAAEDLQLLAAFAQVTALALVSAEGHRTIETLNRELKEKVEKIAEQQRRILALQSQLMKRQAPAPVIEEPRPTVTPLLPAPDPPAPVEGLVGSSERMQQLMGLVRRVAPSPAAVLLRGESGTGKELLARAIHENSPRAGKPFIKVHCAALSPGLLESELFGHVKGAFTSAIRDKVGRFESADHGTLFLDEIGDINLEVQTKLLRVLEEMTFERVGSSDPVEVDVRIIAATHRDLESMIRAGRFREDLYFRLNVLYIRVPPLRERVEDIPELVLHFLRVYNHRAGKALTGMEDDVLAALKGYPWPGNVRQLENVIERAVVIAEGPSLTVQEMPAEILEPPAPAVRELQVSEPTLPAVAEEFHADQRERDRREREQLVRALAAAKGNKAEAARALGVARSTLVSRLKKLGLG